MSFIKYLVQRGDFRYILTGSLLGVELEGVDSLPVGYVEQVRMYPLDFEEFCWANGVAPAVFDMLSDCLEQEKGLPDYLCDRLLGLFRQYVVIGGMPDAVNAFFGDSKHRRGEDDPSRPPLAVSRRHREVRTA